ncbi:PH domain-containing protein [Enterococcus sp. SMC-9]|uniref:PH domain-containing protein n=1 Tax=Enterococcus sp. SMC-9 TaxID=2862343 RepID=UPI001E5E6224|nr:PH domain-containing protein [Enterococcus sp. SMC-9]MCD1025158.1 PH domain-containing protein [Enterococcus sp. SMC-9]
MSFKEIIFAENAKLQPGYLSTSAKKDLFKRSKYYILFQEVKEKLQPNLAVSEEIMGYLPMTVEGNSGFMNAGPMAMGYARTSQAKQYVKTFNDTRGNRLLIFTNTRMIFLTLLDFFETGGFSSFPYDKIKGITTKKWSMGYWDEKRKRQTINWFFLDFAADTKIFNEVLTEKEMILFKENWQRIEKMRAIAETDKVLRNQKMDMLFSNLRLWFNLLQGANVLLIVLAIFLILAVLFLLGSKKTLFGGTISPIAWFLYLPQLKGFDMLFKIF